MTENRLDLVNEIYFFRHIFKGFDCMGFIHVNVLSVNHLKSFLSDNHGATKGDKKTVEERTFRPV